MKIYMIFNINKKFAKTNLENMFFSKEQMSQNYSMYDAWYVKKFNKSGKEIFREHYDNFKPTLDQIEKFDVTSLKTYTAEAAHLDDLKYKAASALTKADMNSLLKLPYDREARFNFLQDILPSFNNIPDIKEYSSVLNQMDCHPQNLHETVIYFSDPTNQQFLVMTFEKTKNFGNYILKHPDINTIINLMFRKLENCTTQQLELLNSIGINYEFFALVTFEPYLAICLGNVLFFKVFVPLHKAGAFSLFM